MEQRRPAPERIVAATAVTAAVAFMFWQAVPEVFWDTTPIRGDLGAHVLEPAHLRDHLLPHWRLSGWSQAWFNGYPSYTFYFPLSGLVPLLFDLLFPYNVALKLGTVAGPMSLPLAAYAFGRLHRRSRLTAACYGVAMLVPLLQPILFNIGGSLGAAVLGEYAYGLSLSLGLLALGLVGGGLRTGRYRAITAVVLALTVLAHVLPAVTVAVGIAVLLAMRWAWPRLRWMAVVGATAVALAGFWLVPLVIRQPLTAGPDYPRFGALSDWLFPSEMAPIIVVALLGLGWAAFDAAFGGRARQYRLELFMAVMALTSALLVAFLPVGRVQHTRFIAPWFMWLALLAANALTQAADWLDRQRATRSRGQEVWSPHAARLALPLAMFVALLPAWDTRLGRGLLTKHTNDATAFVSSFLDGYERSPMRAEATDYVDTVRRLARTEGCGRALVDWNDSKEDSERLGLGWMLPHWTRGCITTTGGLSVQSSATTPFIDNTTERLSFNAETFEVDERDKQPFDLERGIADLRLLGVRYFFASHRRTHEAADRSPELRLVAQTGEFSGIRWKVYEVSDGNKLVEPLRFEPVVASGWDEAADRWYEGGDREVMVAAGGPPSWDRVRRLPATLPRWPLPEATVSDVRIEEGRVSFDVSTTGVPVLVKVSYFPNWRAEGADGPFRVAPNHMVVVPRERTVTLRYGRTPADHLGTVASVLGVVAMGVLARRPPMTMPAEVEPEPEPKRPAARPGRRPSKKRRR